MPSRDDVIRMAEALGVKEYGPMSRNWSFELSQLERFAQLVAEHEREACAQLVRDMGYAGWDVPTIADRIRNRGTA